MGGKAINSWALSLMRYSADIVEWTIGISRCNRKTINIMAISCDSYCYSRLSIPRSEGGRGLLSVAESINIERIIIYYEFAVSCKQYNGNVVEGCTEIHEGR